jgi:6-phosphofructokinase 1
MDVVRKEKNGAGGTSSSAHAFVRAGPRARIAWRTGEAKAAIVTCGGLCPGLNDVICEMVNTLYYNYGVDEICKSFNVKTPILVSFFV